MDLGRSPCSPIHFAAMATNLYPTDYSPGLHGTAGEDPEGKIHTGPYTLADYELQASQAGCLRGVGGTDGVRGASAAVATRQPTPSPSHPAPPCSPPAAAPRPANTPPAPVWAPSSRLAPASWPASWAWAAAASARSTGRRQSRRQAASCPLVAALRAWASSPSYLERPWLTPASRWQASARPVLAAAAAAAPHSTLSRPALRRSWALPAQWPPPAAPTAWLTPPPPPHPCPPTRHRRR